MKLLIVTPFGATSVQSLILARKFAEMGAAPTMITDAKSGVGRLLDIAARAWWLARQNDVVLVDVFGHRAFVYESLAILYAALWRRRVVVVLRGGWMVDVAKRWPRWSHWILGLADCRIVPHEFLRARMTELGFRIDRVIPNFVEIERYEYRLRKPLQPRFLYLRGLGSIYDPETTIRAFALVQREFPDATLTMTGGAEQRRGACEALVNVLGARNVRFLSRVPKEQVPALASEHDIYLQSTRTENMPVSIIEMWAAGLPVVATRIGGISYLVRDGEDGLLAEVGDHEGLSRACLSLLRTPPLAERLSTNGRARALQLTWAAVAPLWADVLYLGRG